MSYVAAAIYTKETRDYFEREQHGEELELVSKQHGVTDDGGLCFHCILNRNGRDVLSTGGDDQLCVTDNCTGA